MAQSAAALASCSCTCPRARGACRGRAADARRLRVSGSALPEDAQRAVQQKQNTLFLGRKLNVELATQRAPLKSRAGVRLRVLLARRACDSPASLCAARRRADAGDTFEPAADAPASAARGVSAEPKAREAAAKKRQRSAAAALADQPAPKKADPTAARTVAVGGLALPKKPGVQLDAALAVARTAGEVSSVAFPCPPEHCSALEQDGCPPNIALVVFATVAAAQSAVAALHRWAPPPRVGDAAPGLWARQLGGEGSQVRRWRLIVRNIAFSATPAGVLKLFSTVGFVWDVHIPKLDSGRARGFAFVAYTCQEHAEAAIKRLNGSVLAGRAVAVDWALSKRHYEAHQNPELMDDEEPAGRRAELESRPAALVDEGALMSQVLTSVMQAGDARMVDAPPTMGVNLRRGPQAAAASRAKAAAEHDASPVTVFAHNLSGETSAPDLQRALGKFGKLRACRLVLDKTTGQSKRTAFVEFADAAAADAAVAASRDTPGVVVDGRQVQLATAVTREEARALGAGKTVGDAAVVKDRRNLYLAREGEILQDSPASVGVSAADMEKRTRAAEEKMSKLQNPNFSVSSTRLHVRNVPTTMDEKTLRSLFVNAVQARTGKQASVKQARLLRDAERLDGLGQQRSRGMGFVDFVHHQDALAALRAVNNNPTIFGKDRRPIVEFALEDARAARKHDLNLKLRARLRTAGVSEEAPAKAPQAPVRRRAAR
jgi:nucleolar protein 4